MARPRWGILLPGALLCLVFLALGVWQVQRLGWKTDLIARTGAAMTAAPVPAPAPGTEGAPEDYEYRRVTVTGRYLPGDTLVRAVSDRGAGYWVMTPFRTDAGWRLLVNRGFVAQDRAEAYDAAPDGPVTVAGLMRASQTGGGFLRANDPEGGRWFSRDTGAIAGTQGIAPVAGWFLDLDRVPGQDAPLGGLTVVTFPNNHLSYALTWFAMAAGLAVLLVVAHRRAARGAD